MGVRRYGLLRESNAEKLISHAMLPAGSDPWLSHWRGRLGLTKAAARAMYERLVPDSEKERRVPVALGEQVEVVFQTWDGEVEKVIGYEGESLMVRISSERTRGVVLMAGLM
jgi:hypothetical protein